MPDEDYFKWKREAEDVHAWDKSSATYQEDRNLKARILRIGITLLLIVILVVFVIVPFFGLLTGTLDVTW